MALAVNSEMPSNAGFNSAGTPWTYTFNNVGGTLLVVGVLATVSSGATAGITGVTYDGVAMTAVPGGTVSWDAGSTVIKFFYLLNPATGSKIVSVTWSGVSPIDSISGAISFTGHDTVNPIRGTAFTATGNSGTASVAATGTTVGNIVVDMAGAGATGGFNARTNTLSWAKNVSGTSAGDNAESTRAAGTGGTVTTSHTLAAADFWGDVAIEVQAGSGGAPNIGFGRPRAPNMVGGTPDPANQFRATKAYLVPDPPAVPTFWKLQSPARVVGTGPVGRFRLPQAYLTTVSADLAGFFGGQASVSGALIMSAALAGTSAGQSAGTASLSESIALQAMGAGITSPIATLSLAEALAVLLSGQSAATGAISMTEALAVVLAGQSTATGQLALADALAGALAGQSALKGDLSISSGSSVALQGALSGQGALLAMLVEAISLQGTPAGQAALTAVLVEAVALQGPLAAASVLTAALSLAAALQGNASGASALSGSLLEGVALQGAAPGQAAMSGSLTIVGVLQLQGALSGTSAFSPTLSIAQALAGAFGGAASAMTALLGIIRPLAGYFAPAGAMPSSTLALAVQLAGAVQGAAALSPTLREAITLAGRLAAFSSLAGGVSSFDPNLLTAGLFGRADGGALFGRADGAGVSGRADGAGVSGRADGTALTGRADGDGLKGRN